MLPIFIFRGKTMETKVTVCNLALSRIGNKGSVENIDQPSKQTEVVCAKWYDIARKSALKHMMPNFARKREIWAQDTGYTPAFGYKYAYKYKSECLKVLGLGNLYQKANNYAIEGEHLLTNEHYPDGLPVRYVADVTNAAKFTPDFIELFSWFLAREICIELTSSNEKYQQIEAILPQKIAEYCGVDSQENPPIRISRSQVPLWRAGMVDLRRKA